MRCCSSFVWVPFWRCVWIDSRCAKCLCAIVLNSGLDGDRSHAWRKTNWQMATYIGASLVRFGRWSGTAPILYLWFFFGVVRRPTLLVVLLDAVERRKSMKLFDLDVGNGQYTAGHAAEILMFRMEFARFLLRWCDAFSEHFLSQLIFYQNWIYSGLVSTQTINWLRQKLISANEKTRSPKCGCLVCAQYHTLFTKN